MSYSPPQGAIDAAARALEWRREYGRGGTEVGVARARDLSNGKSLSEETVRRMASFFARHSNHRDTHYEFRNGQPTTWRIAWDLWGGDAGRSWAERIVARLNQEAAMDYSELVREAIETARACVRENQIFVALAEEKGVTPRRLAEAMLNDIEKRLNE